MDDDFWARIEPPLPPWPERSPGPKPVDDRLCLQGILYVLHQDIAWQLLPFIEVVLHGVGARSRPGRARSSCRLCRRTGGWLTPVPGRDAGETVTGTGGRAPGAGLWFRRR
ncbi:transposase [Streptomyces sp. H72]